jgi:hypothetical protein
VISPIALFLIVLASYGYFIKSYALVCSIMIFAMCNDLFQIVVGTDMNIAYMLSIFALPIIIWNFKLLLRTPFKFLFQEYIYLIILGVVFGLLIPWQSYEDIHRSWSQKALGRTTFQLVKFFADFLNCLFWFVMIRTKKVNFNTFNKIVSYSIIFTVFVGILDLFIFKNQIKNFLFSDANLLRVNDRFTSFNGEPRGIGRTCVYISIMLFYLRIYCNQKTLLNMVALFVAQLGLILSLSASAILLDLLIILIIILHQPGKLKYAYLLVGSFIISVLYIYLNESQIFREKTLSKLEMVLSMEGRENYRYRDNINEPKIFKSFEVFDRAALNFLYFNPVYLIIGTGPNLISIPASDYIDTYSAKIYGKRIDSVPHSGFVNILARSGIIGLLLFLLMLFRIFSYKKLAYGNYLLLLLGLLAYFLVADNKFFFLLGVGLITVANKTNINAIYRNTRAKRGRIY